jgi:hypothetical protein
VAAPGFQSVSVGTARDGQSGPGAKGRLECLAVARFYRPDLAELRSDKTSASRSSATALGRHELPASEP